jgi:tRNA 2-thiocytidine biosynthesis protein TtcA
MRYQLINKVKRAIKMFQLLEDGDKVAIGVSGGKDSIILLYSLYTIKKIWPIKIELNSVFLDLGWEIDYSEVKAFSESLDIPFHYVKTDIGKIVFEEREEKNPCSLCANMRRGALNTYAKSIGCNKVALGHHMDDCVETFMLSLTYEGRINTFAPKVFLDRTEITVIRPLIFVYEKDIIKMIEKHQLPTAKKACPIDGKSKRQEIKELLADMVKNNPKAKDKMMNAITNQIWSDFNENFEKNSIPKKEDNSDN